MMIRTLALLVPVTITPLLAVETAETLMLRGPMAHIAMTVENAGTGVATTRSDVVTGLSILSASAKSDGEPEVRFDLLHALRF